MYSPCAVDFEEAGIGARHGQVVRSESIVGDDDVCHLDPRRGAGVLRDRIDLIVQREAGGRLVRNRGRRVDPELRMIEVAAAVLADDIQKAVAVHREPFVLLGRNGQRIAGIGDESSASWRRCRIGRC